MRITVAVLVAASVLFGCPGVAAAAPKTFCDELKGVIAGQVCQIQITDPAYKIDISLPSFYPDQKALQDYVAQTRDGFVNAAKSAPPRDVPNELDITSAPYGSAVPPRGTQSLVLKIYQTVGDAPPQTSYKAFNWDQGYRKPITYTTLWKPDTDPLPAVFPIVQAELQKQTGQPVAIAPDVGLDPANYQNFAITNDGLIFFFSQGQLLPAAVGATQAVVPRSVVDPMLA
ncbi:esterase [Mycobacterium haemophilum]|uniref:Immunogenic protein MPB64 n=1 Tax=Mycobacterium haemophilum TaxID=29311 RepID=A0A0I9U3G9_9MYCO|nr:esterase [Mycobacterium haemophilum]KLO28003.1 immunogenic protein MPB64 [Mycobacterium haemophilum]KLO35410.1 immunogenic protein MPB64 [Mycobacterium haemophilum]KLO40599.1 immunogenic protein MPB64 [Mycobacterium haemophilum]KLO48017.1 immunogenic protein MPB64 [Mycobacterium haemophilum]